MAAADLYPRFAADRLTEAVGDFPAVLIHGPRQSGKTTLAQRVGTHTGYDADFQRYPGVAFLPLQD